MNTFFSLDKQKKKPEHWLGTYIQQYIVNQTKHLSLMCPLFVNKKIKQKKNNLSETKI